MPPLPPVARRCLLTLSVPYGVQPNVPKVRFLRCHALAGIDEPQAGPLPPEDAQVALGRGGEGRGLLLRLQRAARRVEVRHLPDRLRPQVSAVYLVARVQEVQDVAAATASAVVRGRRGARAARSDPEVGDGGRDRRRGLVRRAQKEGVGGRGQAGYEGEGEAGVVVDRCEALTVLWVTKA